MEQFDERSIENLQLQFSHGQAVSKTSSDTIMHIKKQSTMRKWMRSRQTLVATSTHLLRAKSRPQPCTRSFCNSQKKGTYGVKKSSGHLEQLLWGDKYLKHIPYTAPCISGKYRSHDLNKPAFGGKKKGKLNNFISVLRCQTMQKWE